MTPVGPQVMQGPFHLLRERLLSAVLDFEQSPPAAVEVFLRLVNVGEGVAEPVQRFQLTEGYAIKAGRAGDNQVVLSDAAVSLYHLQLRLTRGSEGGFHLTIQDFSSCGTGMGWPGRDPEKLIKGKETVIPDSATIFIPWKISPDRQACLSIQYGRNSFGGTTIQAELRNPVNVPVSTAANRPAPATAAAPGSPHHGAFAAAAPLSAAALAPGPIPPTPVPIPSAAGYTTRTPPTVGPVQDVANPTPVPTARSLPAGSPRPHLAAPGTATQQGTRRNEAPGEPPQDMGEGPVSNGRTAPVSQTLFTRMQERPACQGQQRGHTCGASHQERKEFREAQARAKEGVAPGAPAAMEASTAAPHATAVPEAPPTAPEAEARSVTAVAEAPPASSGEGGPRGPSASSSALPGQVRAGAKRGTKRPAVDPPEEQVKEEEEEDPTPERKKVYRCGASRINGKLCNMPVRAEGLRCRFHAQEPAGEAESRGEE